MRILRRCHKPHRIPTSPLVRNSYGKYTKFGYKNPRVIVRKYRKSIYIGAILCARTTTTTRAAPHTRLTARADCGGPDVARTENRSLRSQVLLTLTSLSLDTEPYTLEALESSSGRGEWFCSVCACGTCACGMRHARTGGQARSHRPLGRSRHALAPFKAQKSRAWFRRESADT